MKMKNIVKQCFSLLLTLLMLLSATVTAFAAESSVTFESGKVIACEPGSVYTDTDLFDNFKGVMPGDTRSEEITIQNQSNDCDYIKVYMRAVLHDETGNPISERMLAELRSDERRGTASELEYMYDFLSQLSMTVQSEGKVLYDASPDELDGFSENVYLGTLRKGESARLDVQLNVPIDMDNEYANRIGEVEWMFVVEGFDDPVDPTDPIQPVEPADPINLKVIKKWDVDGKDHPDSVKVTLYNGDSAMESVWLGDWNNWSYSWRNLDGSGNWQVMETDIPKGYVPSYSYRDGVVTITNAESLIQTGQLSWPIPVMGVLGIALIAYGISIIAKKRKNERA